jgi:hypothetical protein
MTPADPPPATDGSAATWRRLDGLDPTPRALGGVEGEFAALVALGDP